MSKAQGKLYFSVHYPFKMHQSFISIVLSLEKI